MPFGSDPEEANANGRMEDHGQDVGCGGHARMRLVVPRDKDDLGTGEVGRETRGIC